MNSKDIKGLAELARLELSDADIAGYQKDFEGILDYISTINSVDVDSFDDQVRGNTVNMMREDDIAHSPGEFTNILLDAAPERMNDFVKVDKIL